ncbi:hypothetical protein B0H11DRAFT_2243479 [Mycena galericulata]|nr:hypothetical protein B0H11DRAFT_2243479 [Mycena galericulata]
MMLLRLKKILLTADANWLGTLIHSWPQPFPPQDDADVLSHFAQGFMSWRDGSVPYDGNERVGNSENFLALKMNNISTLERLHHEWKTEWVEARQTQVTASEVVDPLRKAIQENAAKRRAREAKAISILGLLIDAWRNQVTGGWALLCSGPGLYSNLRILRECGVIRDEHQAIEAILEGRPEIVFSSSAVLDGPLRASNSASVTIVGADERFYRDDTAMSSVEPPSRRQSGRLKRLKNEETPIVNRPPVAPLYADRPPAFVMRPDTLPARVLTTRREIIQHEWNKIARDSHAAGIEFINEIDDEEVPPGIGTLFPYLERKYLL